MLRASASHNILVTRAQPRRVRGSEASGEAGGRGGKASKAKSKKASKKAPMPLARRQPQAEFHELSGTILIRRDETIYGKGLILVVCAGTSDIPVAEEALITAPGDGESR